MPRLPAARQLQPPKAQLQLQRRATHCCTASRRPLHQRLPAFLRWQGPRGCWPLPACWPQQHLLPLRRRISFLPLPALLLQKHAQLACRLCGHGRAACRRLLLLCGRPHPLLRFRCAGPQQRQQGWHQLQRRPGQLRLRLQARQWQLRLHWLQQHRHRWRLLQLRTRCRVLQGCNAGHFSAVEKHTLGSSRKRFSLLHGSMSVEISTC